jgi:18S rRNA (guanine1575-N7)-methyltransferase
VAAERGVDDGDVCQSDMGHGLPFRAGSFDGAIRFAFLLRSAHVCVGLRCANHRFLQARVSCRVVLCGMCDHVCSISALQWLCNQDKTNHIPQRRMKKFFSSLYNCLSRGTLTRHLLFCFIKPFLHVSHPRPLRSSSFFLKRFEGSVPVLPGRA